jgi:hypothetical protein
MMPNLVPLHIDKDTGNIIARGIGLGGQPATGFLYEQLAPSATWNISHNSNNDRVIVQVYDELGEFTLPDEILIVDLDNIRITFAAPMQGTAHILFFTSQT